MKKSKISIKNVQAGDIFAAPIGDGYFAFARVMYYDEGFTCMIEIFDYLSTNPEYDPSILAKPRALPILNCSPKALLSKQWNWKGIYRQGAEYIPPRDEICATEFYGGVGDGHYYAVAPVLDWTPEKGMRFTKRERLSEKDVSHMQRTDDGFNPATTIQKIRAAFKIEPYTWSKGSEFMEWLIKNGVYHPPMPRKKPD